MDDVAVEDEKKPFDSEEKQHEEDAQPDPDEPLMMDAGNGRVWLVKVRYKFLCPLSVLTYLHLHIRFLDISWKNGPTLMQRTFTWLLFEYTTMPNPPPERSLKSSSSSRQKGTMRRETNTS